MHFVNSIFHYKSLILFLNLVQSSLLHLDLCLTQKAVLISSQCLRYTVWGILYLVRKKHSLSSVSPFALLCYTCLRNSIWHLVALLFHLHLYLYFFFREIWKKNSGGHFLQNSWSIQNIHNNDILQDLSVFIWRKCSPLYMFVIITHAHSNIHMIHI